MGGGGGLDWKEGQLGASLGLCSRGGKAKGIYPNWITGLREPRTLAKAVSVPGFRAGQGGE